MSRASSLVLAILAVILSVILGVTVAVALGSLDGALALRLQASAMGLMLAVLALSALSPELQAWGPVLLRGRTDTHAVTLSFDDGPLPDTLPALLGALEQAGATATFFLLLDRAERHPELVREIARHHEIALHGVEHSARLVFTSPPAAARELRAAADRLAQLSGRPVRFYRPPFGATSPRLVQAVRLAGLRLTWCSVRTWDGGPVSARAIRRSAARARAGDIVLLHDGRPVTAGLLPVILRDLADRDLASVGLSALLPNPEAEWTS